jgi:hypothetical protein
MKRTVRALYQGIAGTLVVRPAIAEIGERHRGWVRVQRTGGTQVLGAFTAICAVNPPNAAAWTDREADPSLPYPAAVRMNDMAGTPN